MMRISDSVLINSAHDIKGGEASLSKGTKGLGGSYGSTVRIGGGGSGGGGLGGGGGSGGYASGVNAGTRGNDGGEVLYDCEMNVCNVVTSYNSRFAI